jgi:hypothetical protein
MMMKYPPVRSENLPSFAMEFPNAQFEPVRANSGMMPIN